MARARWQVQPWRDGDHIIGYQVARGEGAAREIAAGFAFKQVAWTGPEMRARLWRRATERADELNAAEMT